MANLPPDDGGQHFCGLASTLEVKSIINDLERLVRRRGQDRRSTVYVRPSSQTAPPWRSALKGSRRASAPLAAEFPHQFDFANLKVEDLEPLPDIAAGPRFSEVSGLFENTGLVIPALDDHDRAIDRLQQQARRLAAEGASVQQDGRRRADRRREDSARCRAEELAESSKLPRLDSDIDPVRTFHRAQVSRLSGDGFRGVFNDYMHGVRRVSGPFPRIRDGPDETWSLRPLALPERHQGQIAASYARRNQQLIDVDSEATRRPVSYLLLAGHERDSPHDSQGHSRPGHLRRSLVLNLQHALSTPEKHDTVPVIQYMMRETVVRKLSAMEEIYAAMPSSEPKSQHEIEERKSFLRTLHDLREIVDGYESDQAEILDAFAISSREREAAARRDALARLEGNSSLDTLADSVLLNAPNSNQRSSARARGKLPIRPRTVYGQPPNWPELDSPASPRPHPVGNTSSEKLPATVQPEDCPDAQGHTWRSRGKLPLYAQQKTTTAPNFPRTRTASSPLNPSISSTSTAASFSNSLPTRSPALSPSNASSRNHSGASSSQTGPCTLSSGMSRAQPAPPALRPRADRRPRLLSSTVFAQASYVDAEDSRDSGVGLWTTSKEELDFAMLGLGYAEGGKR